jgi:hypothetical protein
MAEPRPKTAALTTENPAVDAASRLIPLPARCESGPWAGTYKFTIRIDSCQWNTGQQLEEVGAIDGASAAS